MNKVINTENELNGWLYLFKDQCKNFGWDEPIQRVVLWNQFIRDQSIQINVLPNRQLALVYQILFYGDEEQ